MRLRNAVAAALLTIVCAGCATLFSGKNQLITVNSNVTGAEVTFNNVVLGKTPLITPLKKGQEGILRVTAPGYKPYQIALTKKPSYWLVGDLFLNYSSSTGTTVDFMSGAMYQYEPDTYMTSLERATASIEEMNVWKKTEGLRAFVLLNNARLVDELVAGRGEHLEVMFRTLAIRPEHQSEAVKRWQEYYRASATAADFAKKIVSELA